MYYGIAIALILPWFATIRAATASEAWVGPYKGRNVFFVDGKPMPPLMYSGTEHGRETWKDPARKSIREFASAGCRVFQTDFWLKYSMSPDGTIDAEGIGKQLQGILDAAPEAMIVARINVSAPGWWLEKHPDETCKVTKPGPDNDQFAGNRAESLASPIYQEFARDGLRRFLQVLMKLPEAERIIGIHLGGGVYGEWHYYGIMNEPDASEPMRRAFADFARERYKTPETLDAAWKTGFASFDQVVVPSYERRSQAADGEFYDPAKDQHVIDYYHFQQHVVSGFVKGLARMTRETWPRRVIIGVFYGYFYGGFTVGAVAGQNDVETMFRSPHIDYFAGPYASRSMNGGGMFRSLAESAALNGKIWLTEHDGGTHLGSSGSGIGQFPDIPADEAQSVARMRRNFMYSPTERGGQWWYDFGPRSQGGGWWDTPRLMEEAKSLLALSSRLMETPFEKNADVLVVHDMESYHRTPPSRISKFAGKANEDLADALSCTGASFDKIFLMDLRRVDLSKYKLVMFANTPLLDEGQRRFIRDKVMIPGRTVVFLSASGYTDGTRDGVDLIAGVSGMRVAKAPASDHLDLRLKGGGFKIPCAGIRSLFQVNDPDAEVLAIYADGRVGAAMKSVNGCRVYYFGAPLPKDPELLRSLFSEAGVRFFVGNPQEGDFVSAGGGIIGIYSVKGGERRILPLDGRIADIRLQPYSACYLDIRSGSVLTIP